MSEYGAFMGEVGGGEGSRCNYTRRLDTYGCGCAHDCRYCYAKALLEFRGLWHPDDPRVADLLKVRDALDGIPAGTVLRLGGLTDCLQPCERDHLVTLRTLEAMFERGIHALLVTKSHLCGESPWREVLASPLAHVQVSVTSTSDEPNAFGERASAPSLRMRAVSRLADQGTDVQVRLSPYVPELVDLDLLASCHDRVLVEFLRVNGNIRRDMPGIDTSGHTLCLAGYRHLPLRRKRAMLAPVIERFAEVSVCEDVFSHWSVWNNSVNHNPADCCNLRGVTRDSDT